MSLAHTAAEIIAHPPRLRVRSRFVDGVEQTGASPFGSGLPTSAADFLTLLPTKGFSCWVRGNSGLVGFGRSFRITAQGPERFAQLAAAWRAVAHHAQVDDQVELLGSGLTCFATVAFAARSAWESLLQIPQFVLCRRDGRVWLTTIEVDGELPAGLHLQPRPLTSAQGARALPGQLPAAQWADLVAEVSQLLTPVTTAADAGLTAADEVLRKIVLARDEVIETDGDIDVRAVLGRLNQAYPSCWTFDVGGLIGATPELLIGVRGQRIISRVLAGTYRVEADPAAELAAAREVLADHKNSTEHAFAIRSLADSLAEVADDVHVDPAPHLLQLANVIHSASDAHAKRREFSASTALEVAAAVHPTAAVGGFPQHAAVQLIEEKEPLDRGRYAGPVGWMDAQGNGQFGIALRCGQLEDRNRIRLFAGAGIMPDSHPAGEVAETEAKLSPMRAALGLAST